MELNKKIIDRFFCKFSDVDLEQDYKSYVNEKSKKFNYRLLIINYFIGLFVIIDDIRVTGLDPLLYFMAFNSSNPFFDYVFIVRGF